MFLKKLLVVSTFLLLFLSSCSNNMLTKYSESPNCLTTIEGKFIAPREYNYYAPILLFNDNSNLSYKMGKVVNKDENGVFLLERKSGVFHNPETKYYKYDVIRAIVDSSKKLVYGELDQSEYDNVEWKLILKNLDDKDYGPIFIDLVSNVKFSYCAKPGRYQIFSIIEQIKTPFEQSINISIQRPLYEFTVEAGKVNYIGEITFESDSCRTENTNSIAFKKQYSASAGGSNALAGLISGLAVTLINELADSSGAFNFNIEHKENFKSELQQEVVKTKLHKIDIRE